MKTKTSVWKRRGGTWLVGLLCGLFFAVSLRPQHTDGSVSEVTTQERLESEPWWPTMATAPLKAYAGSASCTGCHTEGARATAMQRAAARGSDQAFLKQASSLTFEATPLQYKLESTTEGLAYSVSDSQRTLSHNLPWVIGAGELGRTFLYQEGGRWWQSEVSFYTRPASLDITTGLGRSSGTGLPAALGQSLTAQEARSCFNCHTVHATTSAGLEPLHAEAGLGCEACHGPAAEHISKMTAHGAPSAHAPYPADVKADAVFDPSNLSPEDSIDFCGSCHRTTADAKLSTTQAFGSSFVRFQPYRLQESRCWRSTRDQRLTCVACHNPHEPLNRDPLSYDKQCLQCHAGSASSPASLHAGLVCPKAKSKCVACHMPREPVASVHGDFTDHYIRVVKAGELLPP